MSVAVRTKATRLEMEALASRLAKTVPNCQRCGKPSKPGEFICRGCRPVLRHYGKLKFCWQCSANLLHIVCVDQCPKCGAAYLKQE